MFSKMSIMKSTEIYSQQIKRLKAALDTADTVVIGAGATVPLTGFGSNLAKGVAKEVSEKGWLGVLTGGLTATAGGITAAVLFGFLAALVFKPGRSGSANGKERAERPLLPVILNNRYVFCFTTEV